MAENGFMDSVGLACEVRIECADNNSGMRRDALTVKADEVLPVQRQKTSVAAKTITSSSGTLRLALPAS
jgi:hypothetical protein